MIDYRHMICLIKDGWEWRSSEEREAAEIQTRWGQMEEAEAGGASIASGGSVEQLAKYLAKYLSSNPDPDPAETRRHANQYLSSNPDAGIRRRVGCGSRAGYSAHVHDG